MEVGIVFPPLHLAQLTAAKPDFTVEQIFGQQGSMVRRSERAQ